MLKSGVGNEGSPDSTSVPPRNPQHILEAADGSDNAIEEDPAPGGSEEGEAPEESDESELGMQLYYRMRH